MKIDEAGLGLLFEHVDVDELPPDVRQKVSRTLRKFVEHGRTQGRIEGMALMTCVSMLGLGIYSVAMILAGALSNWWFAGIPVICALILFPMSGGVLRVVEEYLYGKRETWDEQESETPSVNVDESEPNGGTVE